MTTYSTLSLTYGNDRINLEIPEALLGGPILEPRRVDESMPEPRSEIRNALEEPLGRPLLREMVEGKRVGLVISPALEPSLMEALLLETVAELKAGDPREVWVFCACGPFDPFARTDRIGSLVRRFLRDADLKFKFFAHHRDRSPHTLLGTTSLGTEIQVETALLKTEVRIYAHELRHAYLTGYSSTDQLICPGLANRTAIEQNLKRSLSLLSQPGRGVWHPDPELRSNPVSEDAQEFRRMVDRCRIDSSGEVIEQDEELPVFAVNLLTTFDRILTARAGDPAELLPDMTVRLDAEALFEVEKCRYVTVSPGGPSYSASVYDLVDCLDLALLGAIEGEGEALIVAPCDGLPDQPEEVRGLAPDLEIKEHFWDSLLEIRDRPLDECYDWISTNFALHHWKTYRLLRLFKEAGIQIHLYSKLDPELCELGGFIPCEDPQAWIDERVERDDGRLRVIDHGSRMLVRGTYAEG